MSVKRFFPLPRRCAGRHEIPRQAWTFARTAPEPSCQLQRRRTSHIGSCGLCRLLSTPAATNTTSSLSPATAPLPSSNTAASASSPTSSSRFSDSSSSSSFASVAAAGSQDVAAMSRLSVNRNLTEASSWETVENWCELCNEPVNTWDQHIGKREHICLEETLNALVAHPRSWSAPDVWSGSELFREHYAKRPRGQPRTPSAKVRRMLRSGMHVPGVDSPMNIFYEALDKAEPAARRTELLLLLLHLQERGLLSFAPENFASAAFHGQAVLYKEVMPMVVGIFPHAEVRCWSAMLSMICSSFNTDTAFTLCGMEALITPDLLRLYVSENSTVTQPSPSRLKDAAESGEEDANMDSRSGGTSDAGDDFAGTDEEAVPPSLRGTLPRALLGSLRWSLEPESTQVPSALYRQELRYGHYTTLAARACRLLLSELVFNRVSEYVIRVEEVMRSERGMEMIRRHGSLSAMRASPSSSTHRGRDSVGAAPRLGSASHMRALYTRRVVPQLSNYGIVELTGGAGLRAANVLGTRSSENAIQNLEMKWAARRKSQSSGKKASTVLKPMARSVRSV